MIPLIAMKIQTDDFIAGNLYGFKIETDSVVISIVLVHDVNERIYISMRQQLCTNCLIAVALQNEE
jgi:hypothetical protein